MKGFAMTTNAEPSKAMADEKSMRTRRISNVSAVMKWVLVVFMILVVVIGVLIFLLLTLSTMPELLGVQDEVMDFGESGRKFSELPANQRWMLAIFVSLSILTFLISLDYMRKIFAAFQKGDYFTSKTLTSMIWCGIWFVIFGVMDFLEEPVSSVLTTMDLGEGEKQFEIALEGGEIFFIIFGVMFITLGWVMREAASLHEENQQFI